MTDTPTTEAGRPRLLDLFCGAGGAAVGYHRAGFDVVGVDINPQPHYPFEFHQGDAMTWPLDGFDAIHASPPCQVFSRAGHLRTAQGGKASSIDLLTPTLKRLKGYRYVVENVPGAPIAGTMLCGSMFGLKVRRHRIFEGSQSFERRSTVCDHVTQGRPVGVYHVMNDHVPHGGTTARDLAEGQAAMGIDWMPWKALTQAIPPAYTEWIGAALMRTYAEAIARNYNRRAALARRADHD
jgi:hypothetical protein